MHTLIGQHLLVRFVLDASLVMTLHRIHIG